MTVQKAMTAKQMFEYLGEQMQVLEDNLLAVKKTKSREKATAAVAGVQPQISFIQGYAISLQHAGELPKKMVEEIFETVEQVNTSPTVAGNLMAKSRMTTDQMIKYLEAQIQGLGQNLTGAAQTSDPEKANTVVSGVQPQIAFLRGYATSLNHAGNLPKEIMGELFEIVDMVDT